MPWTIDNPPKVAKNWKASERAECVPAANAVLRDEGWTEADEEERRRIEARAITACIHAAGRSEQHTEMLERLEAFAQPRRDECMLCEKLPEVEVVWADGRGRAWFCQSCFEAWKAEEERDIVKQRWVEGKVGPKYGEDYISPTVSQVHVVGAMNREEEEPPEGRRCGTCRHFEEGAGEET